MVSFLLLSAVLFAGSDPYVTTLRPSLDVWDVATADVDGDGHRDIVAICSGEDGAKKEIAIFLGTPLGTFASEPSLSVPLAPESGAVFLSEVNGAAGLEIVVTRAIGAKVYAFSEGSFSVIRETSFASVLPSGSKEPLLLRDVSVDLDGDGIHEWLIPGLEEYEIRNADGLIRRVPARLKSELRAYANMTVRHMLPAVHLFEQAGSDVKGIAFLNDTDADFVYGDDWSQHRRYRVPFQVDEKWDSSARLMDVNNDGFPDIITTQTKGTAKMEVLTQVYIASEPFVYPETPTASYTMKGALSMPFFADVDGNESVDLVFLNIPFGVGTFINYFVRGKVSVKAEVHPFDGKSFPEEPAFKTSLSVDAPDGREQLAFALGDFTGDGRIDAAFATKADELAIHEGEGNRFVNKRAWREFSMPAFGVARVHDLNGNGVDDLIIHHPSGEFSQRIEVIVF